MSKQANPTLIGAFVVGAVAIVVFGIYFFAKLDLLEKKHRFILYFDQSVNGLDVGAPVKFKGVNVGDVDEILLHVGGEVAYVPVIISIRSVETPVKDSRALRLDKKETYNQQIANGLRASLVLQSYLTGKQFIELDYHPEDVPPHFIDLPSPYTEIPTIESEQRGVWSSVNDLVEQLGEIDIKDMVDSVTAAAKRIDMTLSDVEFKKLNDTMLSAFESFGSASDKLDAQIDPVLADMRDAFKKVEDAATSIDSLVDPDSSFRYEFGSTLQDISAAAKSFKNLTDYLERNPSALLSGKKLPGS